MGIVSGAVGGGEPVGGEPVGGELVGGEGGLDAYRYRYGLWSFDTSKLTGAAGLLKKTTGI